MGFTSPPFFVFFLVTLVIYFILPHRFRWISLLASSYYFYISWEAWPLVLIVFSTLLNYLSGLQMGRPIPSIRRSIIFSLSLVANLGLLFFFKYFHSLDGVLRSLFPPVNSSLFHPMQNLVVPIGISFYTFRNLSYVIDVYRGKMNPERHFGLFAAYVAFWPLMLAGPIERASHFIPELYSRISFNCDRVVQGLRWMLWGYFKKVAIANQLAFYVNEVYAHPGQYDGNHCFLATLFFTFQIYCDFSGYSDIAMGASKVMGFDIVNNFERPYFSKSISEFWRRWHISLSTWFRDYVYIPLGGRRVVRWRWYFNLMITFLLVGFWHGANWTFVVWGALHGSYMVFGSVTSEWRGKLFLALVLSSGGMVRKILQIGTTFMLVSIGWVFFRANTLQDALLIVRKSLTDLHLLRGIPIIPGFGEVEFLYCMFLIGVMEFLHLLTRRVSIDEFLLQRNIVTRWGIYLFFLMAIILFSYTEDYQFIYFQF